MKFPSLKNLLWRFLLVLALFGLARVVAVNLSDGEWSFALFLSGLRFDIWVFAWTNLIFLIGALFIWPYWPHKLFKGLLETYFVFVNGLLVATNFLDAELLRFTGRRITADYLSLGGDWTQQAGQLIAHYWGLALLSLVAWILIYLSTRWAPLREVEVRQVSVLSGLGIVFGFLLLLILGLRGGWQFKPLSANHAYAENNSAVLVINSGFSFFKSYNQKPLRRLSFMSDEEAWRVVKDLQAQQVQWQGPRPKNFVLIIMESFALEYERYIPFLMGKDWDFSAASFANGRRSIEALPSLLAAIPSLLPKPFVMSQFQSNNIVGIGQILKASGYHTSFFHGGENGTMFFDSFSRRLGFDQYFGLDEYPEKEAHFDGSWGIYDEEFFRFAIDKLSGFQKPFASVIFSLSSHQPYSVPKRYDGRFPKGELEIHESLGYADFALQEFFKAAEKTSWYSDTLFVVTADHTQKNLDKRFKNKVGPYRVPLVMHWPGGDLKLPKKYPSLSKHADIPATVLDILGIESKGLVQFGTSLYRPESLRMTFFHQRGVYYMLTEKRLYKLTASGEISAQSHRDYENFNAIPAKEVPQSDVQAFKAFVQAYVNAMIGNTLTKSSGF